MVNVYVNPFKTASLSRKRRDSHMTTWRKKNLQIENKKLETFTANSVWISFTLPTSGQYKKYSFNIRF